MIRRAWRLLAWRSPWREVVSDGVRYRYHELIVNAELASEFWPIRVSIEPVPDSLDSMLYAYTGLLTWPRPLVTVPFT